MFVRADQLWLDDMEEKLPLHALEYSWHDFRPVLRCHDARSASVDPLDLGSLDILIGRRKVCVGIFDGDRYIPCPDQAVVSGFAQCERCSGESFIPFQECIFDPRCEGNSEECQQEFCSRPHVLYLAFYNTLAKIGMSSSVRVERRLIEQGADAFAIIGSFPNRYRAREKEKEISRVLGLPQGIRQQSLLKNFSSPLDEEGMMARFDEIKERLASSFGLTPRPLRNISGYPLELPLPSTPILQETSGRHKGDLLGLKGKWLIYESDGIRALSMPDVVSRYLARLP
jgi:hypothetical protein